jgi:hypothetical protein
MKKIIAFVTLFLFALVGFSMNIRSIEIQYEPINNLTYKARVICYVYEHGPRRVNIFFSFSINSLICNSPPCV